LGTLGEAESTAEEDEAAASEEAEVEDVETSGSDEEENGEEEPAGEEEAAEEEESIEEATEEEEVEEVEKEAPTITLEIYEGPIYSSVDNVCYYRIRAKVTGSPAPSVEFSKDDSSGAWGSKKAQVNLHAPDETYTLTATATNSEGTATDSITLEWGCNRAPEISEITLMGNHYVGVQYEVSAVASDPDGDNLFYQWSVTGGSIDNSSSNPIEWTMPDTAGDYDITVIVDDGKGGTDIKTETVEVLSLLGPPIANVDLPIISTEGGIIGSDGYVYKGNVHWVGDTPNNSYRKGYISFDITALGGSTITDATLKFDPYMSESGDLSLFKPLWVIAVDWGAEQIIFNDFNLIGVPIQNFNSCSFTCNSPILKSELQKAIDDGRSRFQIMILFTGATTDNDNNWDIWYYRDSHINLNVTYTP